MTYVDAAVQGMALADAVKTVADLPASAVTGEVRFVVDSGCGYLYNGTAWVQFSSSPKPPIWHLFLDDERSPYDALFADGNTQTARSSEEAKEMVEKWGLPETMSLDHDLGGDDTGHKFLWWLINGHIDELWDLNSVELVQVHSRNPVGAENIMKLWNGFAVEYQILNESGKPRACRVQPARKVDSDC